jgi:hypothetical protein
MKISFNGLRKNIARAFNEVIREPNYSNMDELRMHIANLIAVYDDDVQGDFDDLSDDVKLLEVIGWPV